MERIGQHAGIKLDVARNGLPRQIQDAKAASCKRRSEGTINRTERNHVECEESEREILQLDRGARVIATNSESIAEDCKREDKRWVNMTPNQSGRFSDGVTRGIAQLGFISIVEAEERNEG